MSLLRLTSRRHLTRHPAQLVLSVLGVALGVAVMVAIDLAIQSSREGFRVSAETVAGRATHHLVGGVGGLPDSVFTRVRVGMGIRASAPVVKGYASSPLRPGAAPPPVAHVAGQLELHLGAGLGDHLAHRVTKKSPGMIAGVPALGPAIDDQAARLQLSSRLNRFMGVFNALLVRPTIAACETASPHETGD